jgi:hypothetical protein
MMTRMAKQNRGREKISVRTHQPKRGGQIEKVYGRFTDYLERDTCSEGTENYFHGYMTLRLERLL